MLIENIQGYVDAYHLGYIQKITLDTIECDERKSCEECPGNSMCELMSNGNYREFVKAYKLNDIGARLIKEIEL